mmetsp:Transcript_35661/g.64222  ORF Transcript_35661/g.64222 Transcript_35661/m.64222 type:complete len:159 (-) Transcript_35661:235-711(-)
MPAIRDSMNCRSFPFFVSRQPYFLGVVIPVARHLQFIIVLCIAAIDRARITYKPHCSRSFVQSRQTTLNKWHPHLHGFDLGRVMAMSPSVKARVSSSPLLVLPPPALPKAYRSYRGFTFKISSDPSLNKVAVLVCSSRPVIPCHNFVLPEMEEKYAIR